MSVRNVVEHPACDCCPHTDLSDLERARLAREVWEGCPDSGCLWTFCRFCSARTSSRQWFPRTHEEILDEAQGLMPSG